MTRILLKLSGESFANTNTNFGIDPKVIERIATTGVYKKGPKKGQQIFIEVTELDKYDDSRYNEAFFGSEDKDNTALLLDSLMNSLPFENTNYSVLR